MASGDTIGIFTWHDAAFPSSAAAGIARRNGHLLITFDDSTNEDVFFEWISPQHMSSSTIDIFLIWMAASATSGDVRWQLSAEHHEEDVDDLDSDNFSETVSATFTTASVSGELQYSNMSNVISGSAGESTRFRVRREADSGADTMVGDAQLMALEIRQV